MSEETLQAAEDFDLSDDIEQEEAEVEQPEEEQASESETDTEGEQEETASAPEIEAEDPQRFQERMNKKHYELMQERRQREQLQQQLNQLQQRQPQQRPEIPPMPEPFDDDYQARVQQRDEAIQRAAAFDAQQAAIAQQRQAQQQQYHQQVTTAVQQAQQEYTGRAQKLNISPEEVQANAAMVGNSGLGLEAQLSILIDDHGPLITKHLANNPVDLDQLSRMGPYQAGMKLAEIKAKAIASINKPKKTPPDPVETLRGGGAKPEDGLPGVVYE